MQNISLFESPPLFPSPSGISEEGLVSFRDSHSLEPLNFSLPITPLAPSHDWLSLLHSPLAAPLHQECDELMEFWASLIEPLKTDPLQFWHSALVS